jgi:hypothetical protein
MVGSLSLLQVRKTESIKSLTSLTGASLVIELLVCWYDWRVPDADAFIALKHWSSGSSISSENIELHSSEFGLGELKSSWSLAYIVWSTDETKSLFIEKV